MNVRKRQSVSKKGKVLSKDQLLTALTIKHIHEARV